MGGSQASTSLRNAYFIVARILHVHLHATERNLAEDLSIESNYFKLNILLLRRRLECVLMRTLYCTEGQYARTLVEIFYGILHKSTYLTKNP